MYVKDKQTKWEHYLHLVEFSYNNGYQMLGPYNTSVFPLLLLLV